MRTTIGVALGLFLLLAWQVFSPLLQGAPTAPPRPWFWFVLCLAAFLLALGLRARQNLRQALRAPLRARVDSLDPAMPEEERQYSSGAR